MTTTNEFTPIDYLVIGHITKDLSETGFRLGGTATFSSLTAKALGHSVGIITSCSPSTDFSNYQNIQIFNNPSSENSTFKNIPTPQGRIQYLYEKANKISISKIPLVWSNTPIVHLGPIIDEIDPQIFHSFPDSKIFLTPQGWLREVDDNQHVWPKKCDLPKELLNRASATVISIEDVNGDEDQISDLAALCKILVVTENKYGARVYWHGDVRYFSTQEVQVSEYTGAGDIFAACFFSRLFFTNDPWESARFAVKLAALSVTRMYLSSIPTLQEIIKAKTDFIS